MVEHLDLMFKVSFPIQYQEYQVAFDVGQFVRNNPGPWLGMVIVHKVQVLLHQNGEYSKNAATGITNGGFYRRGFICPIYDSSSSKPSKSCVTQHHLIFL
jgi:hypothetical protein